MPTTQRPASPALTPPGERRTAAEPAREPHPTKGRPIAPAAPAPAVSIAMRLLHRSAAAPNSFMSADERAYLEHRRYGCE